jgi:hypothetical protein
LAGADPLSGAETAAFTLVDLFNSLGVSYDPEQDDPFLALAITQVTLASPVEVVIQPVSFLGESSQFVKSWSEGACEWARSIQAPADTDAYTLEFSSELDEDPVEIPARTAGPADSRAGAYRFITPRKHGRTLRLDIKLSFSVAGQNWAWEGMRVGYNTQAGRTRATKLA